MMQLRSLLIPKSTKEAVRSSLSAVSNRTSAANGILSPSYAAPSRMAFRTRTTSQFMKAIDIEGGAGPASALFINDRTPLPRHSSQECLVKIKAFGVNRADAMQRKGKYPMPPDVTPILGLEFAGTIASVGDPGLKDAEGAPWKEGDEVFGLVYGGAYAEYVPVDARMLMRKPPHWTWEMAAGMPETWFTALQALHCVANYHPLKTRKILWHAGASGVSLAGIQLCKAAHNYYEDLPHTGAQGKSEQYPPSQVFVTSRQQFKCDLLTDVMGVDGAVNTAAHAQDWQNVIKGHTGGEGVDIIFDYMGAASFQQNLDCAAVDGNIVTLGALSGVKLPEGTNIGNFIKKRLKYQGSTLRTRDIAYQSIIRQMFERIVIPRVNSGEFDARVEKVLSWKDVANAHTWLEHNKSSGKVVCLVN